MDDALVRRIGPARGRSTGVRPVRSPYVEPPRRPVSSAEDIFGRGLQKQVEDGRAFVLLRFGPIADGIDETGEHRVCHGRRVNTKPWQTDFMYRNLTV
jgi:hypothetical protein